MSTRGSFIIRKNGVEKALYIACDAYPSYTCPNILSLLKDVNLNDLFDRMVASEFSEHFWFDARITPVSSRIL